MRAFISGQAGVSVVPGLRPQIRPVHGSASPPWNTQDALRIFDGCADVQAVNVNDLAELDHRTEVAWAEDRALRLFLFLLDPTEPSEDLFAYAECLAELLATHSVSLALKRRLAARQLPSLVEVVRVEDACATMQSVRELFRWLLGAQTIIARVRETYDLIPVASFGSEDEKIALDLQLVREGVFLEVVTALSDGKDLAFLMLQVISTHRSLVSAITQWFLGLQGDLKRLPKSIRRHEVAEIAEPNHELDDARQSSYAAFNSIRAQQRSIVGKLKERDIAGARWLMSEMIASQQNSSTPEQIAKSFSNMAQQARLHDVPELQLEWSRSATEVNSLDPMTFGHLANALIDTGRYVEAEEALDSVAANGNVLFAETGRARILRALYRVSEARAAFVATAKNYSGLPEVVHAELGATEALRELGDAHGALAEYRRLTETWPLEPGVWNGLASALMDLGKLDEALQTYSKAASYDNGPIARAGKANAYRIVGDLDTALRIYDEVLVDYPNHQFALCGRADVLQDQGKVVPALAAYELAIERSPYRPEPLLGKARVLRHVGRIAEARSVYEYASALFPSDRRPAAGLIAVYRAQGRFEDALIATDKYIAKFPFDTRGRVARASLLSRLDRNEEALIAYESILADGPTFSGAVLGKAALLIKLQRYVEATVLLAEQRPKTRHDWRRLLLRAFLVENQQGQEAAVRMLQHHIPLCPFAFERRRLRDLLASIELRDGRWREASLVVETSPEEISNIIALHVLAATHRSGQARVRLERIRENGGPADVINLAEEIARHHQLTQEKPHHTLAWIHAAERNLILAEAA